MESQSQTVYKTIKERIGAFVKKQGRMFYNSSNDRMDILFDNGDTYGGLYCGEGFDIKIKGGWESVSIEMDEDWYIPRYKELKLPGLVVRK